MWDRLLEATKLRLIRWSRTDILPISNTEMLFPPFGESIYTYRACVGTMELELGPKCIEKRGGFFNKHSVLVVRLRISLNGRTEEILSEEFTEAPLILFWIEKVRRDSKFIDCLMEELGKVFYPPTA